MFDIHTMNFAVPIVIGSLVPVIIGFLIRQFNIVKISEKQLVTAIVCVISGTVIATYEGLIFESNFFKGLIQDFTIVLAISQTAYNFYWRKQFNEGDKKQNV